MIKYFHKLRLTPRDRLLWKVFSCTLRNEGSLAALKEPLGFFCETRGSFDGLGFFCIRKGSLMYTTGPEGSLASSPHRGFFECNTMVDICLSASVGMIF